MLTDYRSNLSLTQAAQKILGAGQIAITTHAKPDGDAFGSAVALAGALGRIGKDVTAWFMPPVPLQFRNLRGWEQVRLYEPPCGLGEPDLIVVLDTGAWSQIPAMREDLSCLLDRTLIVDHHLTGDVPAAWRYIDGNAAACCEIVSQLIDELQSGVDRSKANDLFTPTICEALFVGLASDTGWFRFSNTRPESHELAGRLLRLGVDQAQLYSQLEQNERPQKLSLMIRALDSLRLIGDNQAAVMVLRSEDFLETGALLEETERFVDAPQVVSSVEVVVLITQVPAKPKAAVAPIQHAETTAGSPRSLGSTKEKQRATQSTSLGQEDHTNDVIRLSFRSKPGPKAVNVAKLAQEFGGGGHARAAGAQVQAPLDTVIHQVTQALGAAIND